MFFASTGIDIGHLITFLFIGFAVALVSRQREMVATITLGLIYGAMAVAGFIYAVTKTGKVFQIAPGSSANRTLLTGA
jgi:hypothetical protein